MITSDENEEVLQQMRESGDDLSKPRAIDFTVVLPDKAAARAFGDHYHKLGFDVSTERSDTVPELPWDVVVTKVMLPTNVGITKFEEDLQAVAKPLGGRPDGWGCYEQ